MNKTDLIQKVKALDGLSQDERAYLINLVNTKKKYGLVWEDKPEEVEEQLRENLPVLKEVKDKAIFASALKKKNDTLFNNQEQNNTEAPNHILIEGDNLHALTALTFTHENKIDLIYIDPPYNTGNRDFKYNDSFVDQEDSYRHSKWLSFMNRRLQIAKRLLNEKGVIFISIDDNEQAQLKLLCEEIFGVGNFLNLISVKAKPTAGASGGGEDKRLKKNVEYLMCFTKKRDAFSSFNDVFESTELQEFIDDYRSEGKSWKYTRVLVSLGDKTYFTDTVDGSGEEIKIFKHQNVVIKTIQELMIEDSITEEKAYHKYFDKIFRDTNAQSSIRQRVIDSTDNEDTFYSIEYKPRSGRNRGKLTTLYYKGRNKDLLAWLSDVAIKENDRVVKKDKLGTLWANFNWNNVSKEGNVVFPNGKKPIALVKRILELCSLESKNDLVLDFFAGSGTTLHATMQLNDEDGGNRQCILVTNNENNICEEVTYERNKRVIQGYYNSRGVQIEALTNNNLRYFKSEFVGREPSLKNKRELTQLATELLCIKEDCYTEQKIKIKQAKLFANARVSLLILFDDHIIPDAVELIKGMDAKEIKVYVFSMGSDPYTEDFAEVLDKVTLCALPDAIYKAYQNVLPKKKRTVPLMEEVSETPSNENGEQLSIL